MNTGFFLCFTKGVLLKIQEWLLFMQEKLPAIKTAGLWRDERVSAMEISNYKKHLTPGIERNRITRDRDKVRSESEGK
jgi:hypothetical protein